MVQNFEFLQIAKDDKNNMTVISISMLSQQIYNQNNIESNISNGNRLAERTPLQISSKCIEQFGYSW